MDSRKIVYATRKGTKATSRKRAIGKHRPLNRYEAEADLSGVSASAKKVKIAPHEVTVDSTFSYCFIAFVSVFSQISEHVVCKVCHSKVKFSQSSRRGLGFKIDIVCESCGKTNGEQVTASIPNSPLIRNGYEINRRIVLAMQLVGVGWDGLKNFCAFMDIPRPLFQSLYDSIVKTIPIATASVRAASMKRAADEEIKLSAEKGPTKEITVSGDGTWRKQGSSSLFGVVTLIGWITKKIVDVVVKFSLEESTEGLENQKNDSQANHAELAEKMEVKAAEEMFARSMNLYNTSYAHYVGDEDRRNFKRIDESQFFKDDSFNAVLWSLIAPKCISSDLKVLTVCSDLAVCLFNDGMSSIMSVMDVLGITIGENCYNFCVETDEKLSVLTDCR